MSSTSFCTFTYNDGRLAQKLLASIPGWSKQPDEIVIVDDGSDPPFSPHNDSNIGALPLRIIRFPQNRGFAAAKSAGINAAQGKIIQQRTAMPVCTLTI